MKSSCSQKPNMVVFHEEERKGKLVLSLKTPTAGSGFTNMFLEVETPKTGMIFKLLTQDTQGMWEVWISFSSGQLPSTSNMVQTDLFLLYL